MKQNNLKKKNKVVIDRQKGSIPLLANAYCRIEKYINQSYFSKVVGVKHMNYRPVLGLVILALFSCLVFADAPPAIPTEYWGRALIDGQDAAVGTPITSAYGNSVVAADGYYSLMLTGGDSPLTDNNDPTCTNHWGSGEACIPCTQNVNCIEGPQEGDPVTLNFDGNSIIVGWGAEHGFEDTDLVLINLEQGYNLVSLPLVPINSTLPAPLYSIEGNYEIVWAYKACDSVDPWKKYVPGVPSVLYDLYDMDPQFGYWIKMATADVLSFAGKNIRVANNTPYGNIDLCVGYNLIGMFYVEGKNYTLSSPLQSIDGNYEIVWAYKALDSVDPWKKYVPGVPSVLYDLYNMYPTFGYWVKMTSGDTLII